jgi:hypothetical protein
MVATHGLPGSRKRMTLWTAICFLNRQRDLKIFDLRQPDILQGLCPFHEHGGARTFFIQRKQSLFYCSSCKAKGSALEFVMRFKKLTADAAKAWFTNVSAHSLRQKTKMIHPNSVQIKIGRTRRWNKKTIRTLINEK